MQKALQKLQSAAKTDQNLMPSILEAVRLYGETLSNTGNPSEERVEGVERALMAERIALPAVG